ncbi:MAG: Na-translocating system protein MpsB [Pirellulales bacterium]
MFGCRPYLAEEQYREKLQHGRIRRSDLATCLREDLGPAGDEAICDGLTRFDLRLAMLEFPLRTGPAEELRWFVAETDALAKMRPETPADVRDRFIEETKHWVMRDLRSNHKTGIETPGERVAEQWLEQVDAAELEQFNVERWEAASLQLAWRICRRGVTGMATTAVPMFHAVRHRDYLLEACGVDSDLLLNELLIRFCAAFVDQGFADWSLPSRNNGFLKSFCTVYGNPGGPPEPWQAGLGEELARIDRDDLGPRAVILESLRELGVSEGEWDEFLTESLVALRGWAGLLRQNEVRGDRVAVPVPQGTLLEFLAVRVVLERFALRYVARTAPGYNGPLPELREAALSVMQCTSRDDDDQCAFQIFQLAQVLGWTPAAMARLSRNAWATLSGEIESFNGLERRRIMHQAFERRFRVQVLDAFALYTRETPRLVESPKFQAVFCIDAREESFRRHLEEIEPEAETFGAPGFYGVAMYYRGASDAHFSTLCPIVVMPQHWVTEEVVYSLEETHKRRAKTRKALGTASLQVHSGSRSLARGALLTAGLGVLASIPLVARVLFPRLTARIRRRAGSLVQAPVVTRLVLERHQDPPGPDGEHVGFNLQEMTDRAERFLRDIGLTKNFSRLVFFFGHGSFCLNNPHKSAYDCGACSGAGRRTERSRTGRDVERSPRS